MTYFLLLTSIVLLWSTLYYSNKADTLEAEVARLRAMMDEERW